jgi:hypothetical protein
MSSQNLILFVFTIGLLIMMYYWTNYNANENIHVIKIIRFINKTESLEYAAFCAGFAWTVGIYDLIEAPLSSTFWGAIMGWIIGFFAEFVSSLLPNDFKPALTIILMMSAIYYFFKPICEQCQNYSIEML